MNCLPVATTQVARLHVLATTANWRPSWKRWITWLRGQFGRAADVLTQTFKAVDMALQDGDLKRASHLVLLIDSNQLLTGRDEQ